MQDLIVALAVAVVVVFIWWLFVSLRAERRNNEYLRAKVERMGAAALDRAFQKRQQDFDRARERARTADQEAHARRRWADQNPKGPLQWDDNVHYDPSTGTYTDKKGQAVPPLYGAPYKRNEDIDEMKLASDHADSSPT